MNYLPAILAVLVSAAMVPLSMWIAASYGLMDRPDARKVHLNPTPRLGGIAIFSGVLVGVVGTIWAREVTGQAIATETMRPLLAITAAGFFVFLVGLVDDLRTVSSRFKLIALVAAAAMVCGSGVVLDDLLFGGRTVLQFQWLSWLITILWIIGVAIAINFIDGLDGLAGGLTLLSAAVLCLCVPGFASPDVAILPMALCGGLLGFLVFNWHPAKTFMGDSGSMTIGFLLASSIVFANPVAGTMRGLILPTVAISVPLVDSLLTMFRRRYQQRRSIFSAERGHIHHRLLDRGLTHRQAVLTIYAVSILAVAIGLVALSFEGWETLGGLALLAPLLWGTFQFAGSVRTDEMVSALKTKREMDRSAKRYRASFEQMQLEFHHISNFSQWWEGVCRAAERLDFVRLSLHLPVTASRDRELTWQTEDPQLTLCERMHASIPVAAANHEGATASVTVEIAATQSLESASERLALFARLMTEYSLLALRQRERQLRSRRSRRLPSQTNGSADSHRHLDGWPDQEARLGGTEAGTFGHLRVAVVHDFLYTYCGAERVLEQLIHVFPHCDVFALFDFLPESQRGFLRGKHVTTSFIQRLPFARRKHRAFLPLMPFAVEQLDVSDYDLVISSSYLAAKGVITGPDQLHICYCHSPIRYAWDLHHHYLDKAGLGFGPKGLLARWILHYIRSWDVRTSLGVDQFVANSEFVSRRIKKIYRRSATVIHPPVDTERFDLNMDERDDFYLVAGRMVPYKRTALIVNAFAKMPHRRLVVIGEGPESEHVHQLAGANVTLLGFQEADVLVDHMRRAKALLFAAEEDFGIVVVESLACGTPVIAYGKGGVTESVIDGQHGVLYDDQTEESLIEAIDRFEAQREFGKYDAETCRQRSEQFATQAFISAITGAVHRWTLQKWPGRQPDGTPARTRDAREELITERQHDR